MTPSAPPLDVAQTLEGKRVLFIGGTGFVGKVTMSMLLCKYPMLGKLYALVRPGSGYTAETRFFQKIAKSRPFDPVWKTFGDGTEKYLREKVVPLAGDVSRPNVGLSDADLALLTQDGPLDVILNSAGLVSFNPSLESALRINVHGVRYVLDLARATSAKVVHVSTCFVAGRREGEVWEDESLIGYFPRRPGHDRSLSAGSALRKGDFDPEAEIADCERLIEQTRQRSEDRAHLSMFREQGADRLRQEGRDPDDERHLKAALQREKKTWTAERLTELGMERAQHWGFTNTYTYTKSIGDQLCAMATLPESERKDGKKPVRVAIVRPAIVESAMSYPFPGWNEGFNTTAPLIFMVLKGHIQVPASPGTVLDMIPVDMVASATIAATAATLAERNELIYHLGSSDSSPLRMPRAVELTGLYKRRHFREKLEHKQGDAVMNRLRSRLESIPVSKTRYQKLSVPLLRGVAEAASGMIGDALDKMWGMPRLTALGERAREKLDETAQLAKQAEGIFDLFFPFVHDNAPIFRADNTRRLFRSLTPHDQTLLRWNPETINWREYMLDVHIPGLEKWIFPSLDEEFQARAKAVYTYRDLLEMLESAAKAYRGRTAMRLLPPLDADGEPIGHGQRYTYRDLSERSAKVSETLRRLGLPVSGKVLLLSENRPDWAISYFGILKCAAVVVPVDKDASLEEVLNICRFADVYAAIVSDKVQARIDVRGALAQTMPSVKVLNFRELFSAETPHALVAASSLPALTLSGRADEMASLIFTSGTTGRPKGVMLSHRNFTSLLAKMGGVFDVDKHDGLLSVLPLHHTFEFSAGLLMPMSRGAQIAYLPEVNADSLQNAFSSAHITGMVGVPALYQLLYRRITKQISDRLPQRAVPWVLRLLERLYDLTRSARERTRKALGIELNLPRALFLPVHQRFGGKLRLLISGGSALPIETMKEFRGLGFNLYEGYGMTESAPVLTVTRPGSPLLLGSVGEALPGVDVKIHEPDATGTGEIIASGPNVMLGYYNDPELTKETIKNGYLHTGDLGRIDGKGHLFIVGRKKDVIIGANGENVYPDELEERYRESPFVKELCVVGLAEAELKENPSPDDKGEAVACLIVPAYDAPQSEGLSREAVREKVREHVRNVSAKLSVAKRVKILHLTDLELPKTATRKVKRKQVVDELRRLERTRRQAQAEVQSGGTATAGDWLLSLLADVTGKPRSAVRPESTMQELGLDSLSFAELGVALEAAGVQVPENVDITSIVSVPELQKAIAQWGRRKPVKEAPKEKTKKKDKNESTDDRLVLPDWLVRAGNRGLNAGQRALYERVLKTRVTGKAYLPASRQFIVAANHSSHLDMGLVKHALGDWGDRLVALAAKDYFFDDPLKRVYFENFTNLIPMDRTGSLRESLRLAARVIEDGYVLLIFPEGTRSESGIMQSFKASIGYLALHHQIDVLPMYLEGTHDAMPKGNVLPKQGTPVAAHIGPVLRFEQLQKAVAKVPRTEQNREAARLVELAVRKLAPVGPNRQMPKDADVE
ncbi:MAG TPA: AMP-binding protein [Pseudomonadota bacterium]|jgi:long-chain acyl-CoA synthetase|nr:AMP-binding protein [Pseudomonadota bacterium]HNK44332.1 AMP-binding protein [Pseudomonadota bacterium]